MAIKVGAIVNCSYELIGRKWVCKNHGKPSKHRVNKTSRFPCLEVDPWDVKELDILNERLGRSKEWMKSSRRKELVEKEKEARRGKKNKHDT